jgi:uncharacterized OB-fold protein
MPPLPALEPESEFFWTSGRDGRLRFLRCRDCRVFVHPPSPRCPRCLTASLEPEAVSGAGEVRSYTIVADGDDQSVVAWIGFPEQDDLRLTAKLVGIGPDAVAIGMPVQADFEQHGDVYLPVFVPAAPAS